MCEETLFNDIPSDAFIGNILEHRFTGKIPEGALASFDAQNNAVNWKLTVKIKIPMWPDVSKEFPLLVVPASLKGNV